jgi:hypothetical protein
MKKICTKLRKVPFLQPMGDVLRFSYQTFSTALYIIRNRKKETQRAYDLLSSIESRYGETFTPATRRKIAVSYGIYTPMICDAFTGLHQRATNASEKERFIHYFICSSLFDDFTDINLVAEQELFALSFSPETFEPRNFDEAVFRDSHLLLKSFVKEKTAYIGLTHQLFQAQWDSKKQAHAGFLSEEALQKITFTKGGLSVLLCSFYLDTPTSPEERDCWYRIGTIIQLTNDLFDIYKDFQDKMDTLPGRMKDARAFRLFFEKQVRGMQEAVAQMSGPAYNISQFRLAMAGIYAFGFIALDQLAELQGNEATLPAFSSLPRKALIIDMERPGNLIKWLRYAYKEWRATPLLP